MQNGTATVEHGLAVSHKAIHSLTVRSSNPAPRYLLSLFENLKKLHMNVYSSWIHCHGKLEVTRMSFKGKWLDNTI